MSKKETVKEAIERIANTELVSVMSDIMMDKRIDIETRVAVTGMLSSAQSHLRLVLARLEL